MDRMKISVDMLNYNVPEAERNSAFQQGNARLVVAQFGGGLHEDLRAKVFGIPNPPATIEDALVAASVAKAERTNQKLVVSLVEESNKEDTGSSELSDLEKNATGVQEVLAISKHGQGLRNSRNRGSINFASYKCYDCNQMVHLRRLVHLRRQCSKPQTPFQSFV